jgi:hypothetical protein
MMDRFDFMKNVLINHALGHHADLPT